MKITKGGGVGALNFFPLAKEGKEIWDGDMGYGIFKWEFAVSSSTFPAKYIPLEAWSRIKLLTNWKQAIMWNNKITGSLYITTNGSYHKTGNTQISKLIIQWRITATLPATTFLPCQSKSVDYDNFRKSIN